MGCCHPDLRHVLLWNHVFLPPPQLSLVEMHTRYTTTFACGMTFDLSQTEAIPSADSVDMATGGQKQRMETQGPNSLIPSNPQSVWLDV